MAKVRGTSILGTLDYARTRHGAAAAERIHTELPSSMRATLVDAAGQGIAAGQVVCRRIEGWIAQALALTLGPEARPVIHEDRHVVREPAVGPQAFCRFVAEWQA